MSAPTLRIEGLNVYYGDHHALKALNLQAYAGELIGVIGPNGAGKTSLIKALCGRLKHNGNMEIDGHALRYGEDRRKLIGLVPQDIGLYPHLSVKENLSVMARLLGVPSNSRKEMIAEAIEAVGMGDKAKALVSTLSGGMKRRINVAAAIMHAPKLIIFDEPTAGVDVPARDVVHRLARTLAERGMTVLLVTHELEQAEALCDKILLLSDGEALAFDAPAKILSHSFGNQREVMVRFSTPPSDETISAMQPFEFRQGELPTIWTAMTEASEVSFVSAFMTALRQGDQIIREISVRRPGLTSLMHRIEATGQTA